MVRPTLMHSGKKAGVPADHSPAPSAGTPPPPNKQQHRKPSCEFPHRIGAHRRPAHPFQCVVTGDYVDGGASGCVFFFRPEREKTALPLKALPRDEDAVELG